MGEIAEVEPTGWRKALRLRSFPATAFLWLAGLVLCLASAFGLSKELCLTEGCRLYQGYGFLGPSMHLWGVVTFAAGLILLVFRLGSPADYRRYLYFCLCAEIVLLTWQVIYLPCSECLLVGLIWGTLGLLEIRDRLPVKVWSVVFLMALVLMGKDMLLHPWPVYGQADSLMKVYFSPSCPSCQAEIKKLLARGEIDRGRAAFFPVALKAGDYERVQVFQAVLNRTLSPGQAFQACWSECAPASVGWSDWLKVRLGMTCNRLVLARIGVNKIPLVVSGSVPVGPDASTAADVGECSFGEGCGDQGRAARNSFLQGDSWLAGSL